MIEGDGAYERGDLCDLNRFISARDGICGCALAELREGLKCSHPAAAVPTFDPPTSVCRS